MTSASAKHVGTKCKKKRRDTVLMPASPFGGLADVTAGHPSETSILSLSPIPLPLVTATAGSSCKVGPSILVTAAPLNESKEMEEIQRKHCGEKTDALQTRSRSRMAAAAAAASEVEPTEFGRSAADEEVVDLTCDSSVVDLTHNDSVVFVEESRQRQNQEFGSQSFCDSCIVCSDNDDDDGIECRGGDVPDKSELPNKLRKEGVGSAESSGMVRCPICMDGYVEIVHSGRLIVSTKCGHIFCSQCLRHYLRSASSCPTCRKKLTYKQCHPIYI